LFKDLRIACPDRDQAHCNNPGTHCSHTADESRFGCPPGYSHENRFHSASFICFSPSTDCRGWIAQAPRMHASTSPESTRLKPPSPSFQPASAVTLLHFPGLLPLDAGLQKRMSVNCPDVWPGYIYAPSRSPKFLCLLPIFQDFAGWWLDPSGTWRNGSCRNQNRKMPARNQKSVFFPDIWPGYIFAPGSSPKFSLPATHFSHAFWLGTRLLHFSASQGLARKTRKKNFAGSGDIKNWKSVFCLDIWPEYIYMHWISPRSKHPPWGQEFQRRAPLLHSCQGIWG